MAIETTKTVTVRRPLLLRELRQRGLKRSEAHRLSGVFGLAACDVWFHDGASESLEVPSWVDELSLWWELWAVSSALQRQFPGTAAGGATACYLLGLSEGADNAHVHVTRSSGSGVIRRPGVTTRRSTVVASTLTFGIAIQPVSEVAVELAASTSQRGLIRMLDVAMGPWHGPPRATKAQLTTAITARAAFRGKRDLLTALHEAHEGVGSPRETQLRFDLLDAGLPMPVVGHAVDLGAFGTIHPDLSYPGIKLAIEYEGGHHFLDQGQIDYDIRRYDELQRAGWYVIRVTKSLPPSWVVERVREYIALNARTLY